MKGRMPKQKKRLLKDLKVATHPRAIMAFLVLQPVSLTSSKLFPTCRILVCGGVLYLFASMATKALGLKPGVVTGASLLKLLEYAREQQFGRLLCPAVACGCWVDRPWFATDGKVLVVGCVQATKHIGDALWEGCSAG